MQTRSRSSRPRRRDRPRNLARRSSLHLQRPDPAKPGPPCRRIQLGSQASVRRRRHHSRRETSRRVGHSRQPSRCLGKRRRRSRQRREPRTRRSARTRRTFQARLEACPHHHLLLLGRRRASALLGSTEWAESHADELKQHAVAYFNSDGNGRGFFRAGGSHSLENFINSVVKDIDDPETKMSVWKRDRLAASAAGHTRARAEAEIARRHAASAPSARAPTTPYSSTISAFPASISAIGGEDEGGGQYHSIYDDFYWYTHFEDTDFVVWPRARANCRHR